MVGIVGGFDISFRYKEIAKTVQNGLLGSVKLLIIVEEKMR